MFSVLIWVVVAHVQTYVELLKAVTLRNCALHCSKLNFKIKCVRVLKHRSLCKVLISP